MLDPDFRDLLAAFASCGVEYLVVGADAREQDKLDLSALERVKK